MTNQKYTRISSEDNEETSEQIYQTSEERFLTQDERSFPKNQRFKIETSKDPTKTSNATCFYLLIAANLVIFIVLLRLHSGPQNLQVVFTDNRINQYFQKEKVLQYEKQREDVSKLINTQQRTPNEVSTKQESLKQEPDKQNNPRQEVPS